MATLTPKQQAFIEHYLTCWNASEAARRAGYVTKANVIGSQLLANPSIAARVQERLIEMKADANEVIALLSDHQRGSLDDFIGESGQIDIDKARSMNKMRLLKKYKTTRRTRKGMTEESVEIELHDPQAAAVQLGRHLGLFVEKSAVEHSGEVKQVIDLSGLTDEQLKLLASSLKD